MKTPVKPSGKKKKAKPRCVPPFPFEFRLKVAKLREEEGYLALVLAEEFCISEYSVYRWAKRYRGYGQRGLLNQPKKPSRSKVAAAVTNRSSILKIRIRLGDHGASQISSSGFSWWAPHLQRSSERCMACFIRR